MEKENTLTDKEITHLAEEFYLNGWITDPFTLGWEGVKKEVLGILKEIEENQN